MGSVGPFGSRLPHCFDRVMVALKVRLTNRKSLHSEDAFVVPGILLRQKKPEANGRGRKVDTLGRGIYTYIEG